jgi:hypothetical protein
MYLISHFWVGKIKINLFQREKRMESAPDEFIGKDRPYEDFLRENTK